MKSDALTPAQYLATLPPDRRELVDAVRKVINENLAKGFREGVQYGMIGWSVPHSRYPAGYHCNPEQAVPFISLASQKNSVSIYLFCLYVEPARVEEFVDAWKATGKKLDMGKSCVRVKTLEDIPLEVIANAVKDYTVEQFIEHYEAGLPKSAKKSTSRAATSKKTKKTKKIARKKAVRKPSTSEKRTAKKRTAKKRAVKKQTAKKSRSKKTAKRAARR
ncbi:MAG: DUF1801 domain-containing protein [Planctomycetes bacterium]|nr:DUF1801 domain-containing protein [Planctomycetota bacterium]